MKKYKFFDHTADVMFEAYGKTLNELFENAALATQETQVDLKDVKGKIKRKINLKNKSIEMLLFDFLQELIFLKDSQYSLFSKFKINIKKNKDNFVLESEISGEKINPKTLPLSIKDIDYIKHKIINKVKAELFLRISKGYTNIDLNLIEQLTNKYLKETNILEN